MPKSHPIQSTHLTVTLAAESIHVAKDTILAWIASGELPASNISKSNVRPRWRISKDDLSALMKRRSNKPKQKRSRRSTTNHTPQYV